MTLKLFGYDNAYRAVDNDDDASSESESEESDGGESSTGDSEEPGPGLHDVTDERYSWNPFLESYQCYCVRLESFMY